MKNKGFTLIELLAVIVILAIIALIAVPIILNIIGDAKKESDERSKDLYLNAVEQAIARKNLTEEFNPTTCTVNGTGNLTCTSNGKQIDLTVEVEGTKPTGGTITIKDGVITSENLVFGGSDVQGDEPKVPEAVSFETDSWETIAANVKAGTDIYKVGDTKEVTLSGTEFEGKTFTVRVANTSTPAECRGADFSQTACGFVLEFEDVIANYNMNSTDTNVGGYPKSAMYTYLKDTVFKALPEELQNVIIDTKVISGNESGKSDNYITEDKLYLLSTHEIWENGTSYPINNDSAWNNTRQLDYYADREVTTDDGYTPAIKKIDNVATYWWLRSALSGGSHFYAVSTTGLWNNGASNTTAGVAPAFRLG